MNVWPILTTVIRLVLTLWVASTVDVTLDKLLPQMEEHALVTPSVITDHANITEDILVSKHELYICLHGAGDGLVQR